VTEIPKPVPGWQLAIRFALEVGALVAIGRWVGVHFDGAYAYLAGFGAAAFVALLWVTFAVPGDPSRSGRAPVPIPGVARLALELAVFLSGAAALAAMRAWPWFAPFLAALVVHHLGTLPRLRWLVRQ
jgi:hypothetical protein